MTQQQVPPSDAGATGLQANLLWTGGWDSTFHLLRLLLVYRIQVTPYYLLRERRPSTPIEIATMDRIRNALAMRHPHTRNALQPTRFFDVEHLAPSAAITDAYERTLQKTFLGRQYEWLAWFCAQEGIEEIELCIHRDDKAHAVIAPYVREVDGAGYRTYRFDLRHVAGAPADVADLALLFRHFGFPLFEVTKMEMAREATARGWQDLMEMTWFCHSPLRNQQPCGCCHPCLYTIEEGLGYRLPRRSRIRSAIFRTCLLPFKTPILAVLDAARSARDAIRSPRRL